MSLQDSALIVLFALILFGPKKLPVLARQFGKLMADFRRASNEFRTQMEEELRISEQTDRQKQIAAIEASAPSVAATIPEPEHPHLPSPEIASSDELTSAHEEQQDQQDQRPFSSYGRDPLPEDDPLPETPPRAHINITPPVSPAPVPIATSGDLSIHPPATGLPISNGSSNGTAQAHTAEAETETLHG